MKKTKLFCLPYAGGSAAVFKKWATDLGDSIDMRALELSGRGKRTRESLYNNADEAVNDVYNMIAAEISDGAPYAVYGHSMGAMLAYEAAQKIRKNSLPAPLHLFFSGRGAPHLRSKREKLYHLMSEDEFKKEVLSLGGTPAEFFEYPELVEYLLPILKNDFKISETSQLNEVISPFEHPITVFTGKEETELEAEDVHGWMLHTKQVCNVHYFNGGHFFINEEAEAICSIMKKTIQEKLNDSHRTMRNTFS